MFPEDSVLPADLCSPRARVSAAPLCSAPSQSSQQQNPASPATVKPGEILRRAPRIWSRLHQPQLQLSPQSGLRAPKPRISLPDP